MSLLFQVGEIVYSEWNQSKQWKGYWFLAQVVSFNASKCVYKLHYMDGDVREDVPHKQMRKLPKREKNNKMIGKRFYDEGDNDGEGFTKGEFVVLCYQPGSNQDKSCYWCERDTFGDEERDIQSFGLQYVSERVIEYENE